MEACFEARFPQEGVRQGEPDPQEFVIKAIQELQESRVMKGGRLACSISHTNCSLPPPSFTEKSKR